MLQNFLISLFLLYLSMNANYIHIKKPSTTRNETDSSWVTTSSLDSYRLTINKVDWPNHFQFLHLTLFTSRDFFMSIFLPMSICKWTFLAITEHNVSIISQREREQNLQKWREFYIIHLWFGDHYSMQPLNTSRNKKLGSKRSAM